MTTKTKSKPIIETSAGRPYGHVPGHSYCDCDVVVRRAKRGYVATASLHWGSAQGYDEEHGRVSATSVGSTALEAIQELRADALDLADTDDQRGYVRTALSRALQKAVDL